MAYKDEFETVDLILKSDCVTKGVDAFALTLIKSERQIRKIFTHLVYQNPGLQSKYTELRMALAESKNTYFEGFISGINCIYPVTIQNLIGEEYQVLLDEINIAISVRNKIFHGQVTDKGLEFDDLEKLIGQIRKWCELLSLSCAAEFGYDGFGRNSLKLSSKPIYKMFLIKLESIDEYREFIKRHLERKPSKKRK